jgi:hypothetical protein
MVSYSHLKEPHRLTPQGPELNKSHGGHVAHVGVPDKSLIKILLNWNTNMAAVQTLYSQKSSRHASTCKRTKRCGVLVNICTRARTKKGNDKHTRKDESD